MKAINSLADTLNLPCYLECGGPWREKMYGKSGYETAAQTTFEISPDAGSWPPLVYTGMKRPATGKGRREGEVDAGLAECYAKPEGGSPASLLGGRNAPKFTYPVCPGGSSGLVRVSPVGKNPPRGAT